MPASDLDPDKTQLERSFPLLSASTQQGQKKNFPPGPGKRVHGRVITRGGEDSRKDCSRSPQRFKGQETTQEHGR